MEAIHTDTDSELGGPSWGNTHRAGDRELAYSYVTLQIPSPSELLLHNEEFPGILLVSSSSVIF